MVTPGGPARDLDTRLSKRARVLIAATALILIALMYAGAVWVLTVHRLPDQPLVPASSFQNPQP